MKYQIWYALVCVALLYYCWPEVADTPRYVLPGWVGGAVIFNLWLAHGVPGTSGRQRREP
jgi:hypothetical protein